MSSYHSQSHNFVGSTTRPFASHPQTGQMSPLGTHASQPSQQTSHQQHYTTHLQHHNTTTTNNPNGFGIPSLTNNYKIDNPRDSRTSTGLQGYNSMSSGNWANGDLTGFGSTQSSSQLSHNILAPHHTASSSLPLSPYSQPSSQTSSQAQTPQQQQQQQNPFMFSAHNQSPTQVRVRACTKNIMRRKQQRRLPKC